MPLALGPAPLHVERGRGSSALSPVVANLLGASARSPRHTPRRGEAAPSPLDEVALEEDSLSIRSEGSEAAVYNICAPTCPFSGSGSGSEREREREERGRGATRRP